MIGENIAFLRSQNPLFSGDFGLTQVIDNQGYSVNPGIDGQTSFTSADGRVTHFAGDEFSLNGGCPTVRAYDGALSSGSAVITHRYTSGTTTGPGAVIMNRNVSSKWNTIWMGFGWSDIRDASGASPSSASGAPDAELARKILGAVLPIACIRGENPTDTPGPGELAALPAVSRLHPNTPNPFNPTTTITFDLAREGHVSLRLTTSGVES